MGRGTTPSSSRSLRIRTWPPVKRISIDYVRSIFSKRRLPLDKEYRLVWSERQLGHSQLDSPSPVTHWFNIGVLSSPILSKPVSSSKCVRSSLSLSVLWLLPQHKLRCLLLFAVPNTMPSYSHSSFLDLATNFWEVTIRIFICNVVQEMFSAVRSILVYYKVPSICFSVLLVRVHVSLP